MHPLTVLRDSASSLGPLSARRSVPARRGTLRTGSAIVSESLPSPAMDPADIDLRNATYRRFVELGRAPTAADMAEQVGVSETAVAMQSSAVERLSSALHRSMKRAT